MRKPFISEVDHCAVKIRPLFGCRLQIVNDYVYAKWLEICPRRHHKGFREYLPMRLLGRGAEYGVPRNDGIRVKHVADAWPSHCLRLQPAYVIRVHTGPNAVVSQMELHVKWINVLAHDT